MTVEELVREIAHEIKRNCWRESNWLTPDPNWYISCEGLLNHIAVVTGIPKGQIGEWVDEETKEGRPYREMPEVP